MSLLYSKCRPIENASRPLAIRRGRGYHGGPAHSEGEPSREGSTNMRAFEFDSLRLPVPTQLVHAGHRHERHRLSRRAFMGGAAGVTGTVFGAGLLGPAVAAAAPRSSSA